MISLRLSKIFSLVSALMLTALFLQCAPALRRPAISLNETRWQIIPLILQNNFNRLRSLKGSGKLVVESPEMSYSANTTIIYKNPDSILIKIEAIFGIDVGSLFADKNAFKVYVPSHNTVYFGKSNALADNQFIAFKMNYDRLIQAVTGLNLATDINNGILRKAGNDFVLYGKQNSHFIKYWIDAKLGVVTKCEIRDRQNRVLQSEEYGRFTTSNGVVVPKTIRIKRPLKKESFTLFYETISTNPQVVSQDFTMKVPKNAIKIML